MISGLDVLTDGGFLPYRDHDGKPRLLDVQPPVQASRKARPLYAALLNLLKSGAAVHNQATYRVWYFTQVVPLQARIDGAGLGRCMGDEGLELSDRVDQITSLVHQTGWMVEDPA